jgi:hypothetical protein
MNDDIKLKITNWLEQKWPKEKRNCEICNQTRWSVSEDIVAPIILENNGLNLGGKTYPQVMLICSCCGNTKYFNVALMNILKAEK